MSSRSSSSHGEANMGSLRTVKKIYSHHQPKRGPGVAQLERMRLEEQLLNINLHSTPNYPSNYNQRNQTAYSALPSYYSSSSMASPTCYGFSPGYTMEDHRRIQTAYSAMPSYSSPSMVSSACYAISPNNYIMEDHWRIQTTYSALPSYSPNNCIMLMGHEIRYGDYSQPSTTTSWINPRNSFLEGQYYGQTAEATRQLFNLHLEDTHPRNSKKYRSNSMELSSQNSESSDSEELDLELRLSIPSTS